MEANQQNNTNKYSNDLWDDSPIPDKDIQPTQEDKVQSAPEEHKSSPVPQIPQVINIQKEGWTIANKIAMAAVLISAILGYYTYRLYKLANTQTEASIISANAAKDAVNISKEAQQEARINAERTRFEDSIRNRTNYMFDSVSLQTQIDYLKETNKQFELQHEPLLTVISPRISVFKTGEPIQGYIHIRNLGVDAAKGDSEVYVMQAIPKKSYEEFKISPFKFIKFKKLQNRGTYFSKDSAARIFFYGDQNLTNIDSVNIINGKFIIVLCGIIKYSNPINKKRKKYVFVIELPPTPFDRKNPNPFFGYDYIYNVNS